MFRLEMNIQQLYSALKKIHMQGFMNIISVEDGGQRMVIMLLMT